MTEQEFIQSHFENNNNKVLKPGTVNFNLLEERNTTPIPEFYTIKDCSVTVLSENRRLTDQEMVTLLQQIESIAIVFTNTGNGSRDKVIIPIRNKAYYPNRGEVSFFFFNTEPTPINSSLLNTISEVSSNTIDTYLEEVKDEYDDINILFEPFIPSLQYAFSEFNPIIGNAINARSSTYIVESDRGVDSLTPSNFNAISSGSASPAQLQDSLYSLTGWSNSRYGGTKTDKQSYNNLSPSLNGSLFEGEQFTEISTTDIICGFNYQDRVFSSFIFTGEERLPTVEYINIGGDSTIAKLDQSTSNIDRESEINLALNSVRTTINQGDILRIGPSSLGAVENVYVNSFTPTAFNSRGEPTEGVAKVIRGYKNTSRFEVVDGNPISKVSKENIIVKFINQSSRIEASTNARIWISENNSIAFTDDFGVIFKVQSCEEQPLDESQLSINPTTKEVVAEGESFTLEVDSNTPWEVTTQSPWLTITNGSGDGLTQPVNVTITAAENTADSREGQIRVRSQDKTATCTVTQLEFIPDATLTISPDTQQFGPAGGTFTLEVRSNIEWQAANIPTWVTFSNNSFTGDRDVTVTVDSNSDTSRSASITISGGGITRTLSINQDEQIKNLSIDPTSGTIPSAGGSTSFDVSSNVTWSITSFASFITGISPSSGTGNATVAITAAENDTLQSRSGTLSVSGEGLSSTYQISQLQKDASLSISPTSRSVSSDTSDSFNITVTSNTDWQASVNNNWLTINGTSFINGSGNGGFTVNIVEANPNFSTRSATISVQVPGRTVTCTVRQDAKLETLSISPSSFNTDNNGGSFSFNVSSNTSWNASDNRTWISAGGSGTGNGTVSGTVASNSSLDSRSGAVTVTTNTLSRTFSVNQEGIPAQLTLSRSSFSTDSDPDSFSFSISSNISWNVSKNQSWISISKTSGSGNDTVSVSISENTSSDDRNGSVTVSGGGVTRTISIDQAGKVTLAVDPTGIRVPNTGRTFDLSINADSNLSWTAQRSVSWIEISSNSGTGSTTIQVEVKANFTDSSRNGGVTVSGGGETAGCSVRQDAGGGDQA